MQDVIAGAGLLVRGLGIVLARPKLFGLGMVPPLITSVLMIAGLVALGLNLDTVVRAITGFTQQWGTAGEVVRWIVWVVLFLVASLVMVLIFTTVTLALGDPIYQRISQRVDVELGPLSPEREESTGAGIIRSLSQTLATIGLSVVAAIACLLIGLIPAVGAALAALTSAVTGGRLMVRELTGPAFERRGLLQTAERRPILSRHRALALGFGVPAFWLLSIPLLAVFVFPAAVAGATLLVRRMQDEATSPVVHRPE